MKKKVTIHEFDPVIYPYKIWVVIDKKPGSISEMFYEYDGSEILSWDNTSHLDAMAMSVMKKDNSSYGAVVYFRSKKSMTYNIIAHECSHAAKMMFEHIGADVKPHEPFEYVVGWIAECCEKVLKNKD